MDPFRTDVKIDTNRKHTDDYTIGYTKQQPINTLIIASINRSINRLLRLGMMHFITGNRARHYFGLYCNQVERVNKCH